MCANVTSMSYIKNDKDQEWAEIEYRYNSTYYNRIWNDPEVDVVYKKLTEMNIGTTTSETNMVWVFGKEYCFPCMHNSTVQ